MQLHTVKVVNPDGFNVVMGASSQTKTIDDINRVLEKIPDIQFGLAFNQTSNPIVVKHSGTNEALIDLAAKNASNIGVVDFFVLFYQQDPLSALKALKQVDKINRIYCATEKPVEVIVVETDSGRGVMGLVDDNAH